MKITIKEEMGFEPMRRFTDLTVFKTVPLSLTWVFFHKWHSWASVSNRKNFQNSVDIAFVYMSNPKTTPKTKCTFPQCGYSARSLSTYDLWHLSYLTSYDLIIRAFLLQRTSHQGFLTWVVTTSCTSKRFCLFVLFNFYTSPAFY